MCMRLELGVEYGFHCLTWLRVVILNEGLTVVIRLDSTWLNSNGTRYVRTHFLVSVPQECIEILPSGPKSHAMRALPCCTSMGRRRGRSRDLCCPANPVKTLTSPCQNSPTKNRPCPHVAFKYCDHLSVMCHGIVLDSIHSKSLQSKLLDYPLSPFVGLLHQLFV